MSTRLYTAAKSATTTRVEEIENISLSLSIWYCQYPFRASAQHTHSLSLWKKTTPFLLISFWSHPLSPLSSTPNDIYLYSVVDLSRNDIYSTRFLTQHPPNIYMSSYPYYSSTLILYALYMAYVSNNQVGGIYGFFFDLTAIVNDGRWRYPNWPFWNFWPKGLLTKMVGKQCHRTILSFE